MRKAPDAKANYMDRGVTARRGVTQSAHKGRHAGTTLRRMPFLPPNRGAWPLRIARLQRPAGTLALAALLALWAYADPVAAQWKWRDAAGQITVSDRPPPRDIPEKDILARPETNLRRPAAAAAPASAALAAASGGATAPRTPLDAEVEARRRAAEQDAAAKTKADEQRLAHQRAENCRRARAHLSALESGQRLARVNDKGEREVMDDKTRADEMRAAREVVSSDCR